MGGEGEEVEEVEEEEEEDGKKEGEEGDIDNTDHRHHHQEEEEEEEEGEGEEGGEGIEAPNREGQRSPIITSSSTAIRRRLTRNSRGMAAGDSSLTTKTGEEASNGVSE